MSYFFQLVVSGIVVGSIYALSALGFVLIYKSSRVLNIAHGQIIAAGAFITYALTVFVGIHIVISFLLSMVITFFLAMSVERIFLRRLIGEPIISVIMVTIGLMSIIDGLIYMTPFGAENFSFPEFLPKTPIILLGDFHVLDPAGGRGHHLYHDRRLYLVFQGIHGGYLHAGGVGRSVRLHVHRHIRAQGFRSGLGHGRFKCGGGRRYYRQYHRLEFRVLQSFGIIVFPVVIVGGLDSIFGAIVAGIIMGLIQQFAAGYLDGNWGLNGTADVLPYIILLIILLFKPHGLFGIHEIERV